MKNAPAPTTSTASATTPRASTSTSEDAPKSGASSRPGADAPATAAPAARPAKRSAQEIVTALRTELTALSELLATPPAPGLHLSAVECDKLAEALGLGAAVTATAILTAVDRLASVRVGDIRIPFTPGQLAELQHRASKRGRTVEAEMRAVVARIENELFYQGG